MPISSERREIATCYMCHNSSQQNFFFVCFDLSGECVFISLLFRMVEWEASQRETGRTLENKQSLQYSSAFLVPKIMQSVSLFNPKIGLNIYNRTDRCLEISFVSKNKL